VNLNLEFRIFQCLFSIKHPFNFIINNFINYLSEFIFFYDFEKCYPIFFYLVMMPLNLEDSGYFGFYAMIVHLILGSNFLFIWGFILSLYI
jgi:hypothetical protein